MNDLIEHYREHLLAAGREATPLAITGSGSKTGYGREPRGEPFAVGDYAGVIDYSPTELVITARAGTPLAEIEAVLAAENQVLGFEPPHLGDAATLGGTIACGLSGPRRPYAGAARDFVLGITCLNGKGEYLRFGGRVMKNVAGYDVSRTLAGSLGTLAVLLDVSLRVLPRPETERTLVRECTPSAAIEWMNEQAGRPLPLSAACYHDGRLAVRLSGHARGVEAAAQQLGGEPLAEAERFWADLRERRLEFFTNAASLWRFSLPPATPPLAKTGAALLDWGGAQRWVSEPLEPDEAFTAAHAAGGHASRIRGGTRDRVFQPLPAPLLALHRRLKAAFDPHGILNPGRMYAEL